MNQLSYNDDLAIAVSHDYALNYHLMHGTNIHCFNGFETIQEVSLKVLMKKDFRYIDELNRFIKYSVEGGLIKKWLTNEEMLHKYDQIEPPFYEMTLKSAVSFFFILIALWVFCIFVALAEHIVYRKAKKQQNPSKFWIYAERMINTDRLYLLEHKTF